MSKKNKLVIICLIIVVILSIVLFFVFSHNNEEISDGNYVSVPSPDGGQSVSLDGDQSSFSDTDANDDVQDNRDSRVGSSKSIRNDN